MVEIALEMAEVDLVTLFRTSGADRGDYIGEGPEVERPSEDYSEAMRAG